MKNYVDYNFYIKEYKGKISETEFDKVATRASLEIRNTIMNKDITRYEEEVQMATCSVVDILHEIEKIKQRRSKLISSEKEDKVIASEQVADLSKSFANVTNIKDLDNEILKQEEQIRKEIEKYLFYTGLLNRRVYGRFI
ncbi:MAG: hypothetical protein ACLUWN_01150 [Clostridia bacterium]|jgi:hypothetical protein|nr:MAG TPA: Head Tail Connector Protein [Caudoviricetes sp.]